MLQSEVVQEVPFSLHMEVGPHDMQTLGNWKVQ